MRILIVSQYFFPETGATPNRIYSLASKFKEHGHYVKIITEKPNHPGGIFFRGFEKGIFKDKRYNGIPVTYSWVYTRPEKGFFGRILFYLTFMITAIIASFRLKGKFDVICASSPPLFVGISGWIIARLKKAKFVFDVRDLWPDVAVKMGALNNNCAIRLAEKVEKFIYTKADLIIVVTNSFKKAIATKGISSKKIKIVTNGTDPDVFYLPHSKADLRKELDLDENFIVSYVGNLGLAQGLDHIVEAAEKFGHYDTNDVSFLFVGDGHLKSDLMELAATSGVNNVTFIDRVPLEVAVKFMNASDILLVPLANDPIYSQFIPSKLFDSMAASKPILLSVDGESRAILDEAKAGFYYEAENADQLVKYILRLKNDADKADKMAKSGRRFVKMNYTRDVQAGYMVNYFKKLIK